MYKQQVHGGVSAPATGLLTGESLGSHPILCAISTKLLGLGGLEGLLLDLVYGLLTPIEQPIDLDCGGLCPACLQMDCGKRPVQSRSQLTTLRSYRDLAGPRAAPFLHASVIQSC